MSKVKDNKLALIPLMASFMCLDVLSTPSDIAYPLNEDALENNFLTINFNDSPPLSYGVQDKHSNASVSYDGVSLKMAANTWKYIPLDYEVTENTILEFDVVMNSIAEIQGIGFQHNTSPNNKTTFQLAGTANWATKAYSYQVLGETQHVKINVGESFTGHYEQLVFIADNDAGNSGDIKFSNVIIKEKKCLE